MAGAAARAGKPVGKSPRAQSAREPAKLTSRLRIKRVYDPPARTDGCRILAERLWPRGLKKDELSLDAWARDVAPSPELRKWFAHDPAKWTEFRRRYFVELDANEGVWTDIVRRAKKSRVTLLFSSKDPAHNNVVALREYLAAKK